jgi:hypothetical protein
MKKIFIFFLCTICSNNVIAQNYQHAPQRDFSVGAILLSEQNTSFANFASSALNGIIVKHIRDKFTYRLAFEVRRLIDPIDKPKCCDGMYTQGDGYEKVIRIGLQKQIKNYRFIKPYLALDALGSKGYLAQFMYGGDPYSQFDRTTSSITIGASTALGLQCNLSKRISASIESRFGMTRSKNEYVVLQPYIFEPSPMFSEGVVLDFRRFSCLTLDYKF